MRNTVNILFVAFVALLAGCVNWYQAEDVKTAAVHKIETPLAAEFCSKLLGGLMRACSVRMTNTATGVTTCVIVVAPDDLYAVQHEAGGHCMGQDHQ